MKITLIEEVQDWMKDRITRTQDIRTMHELALCAVMHHVVTGFDIMECSYSDRIDNYTIDNLISSNGLFQDGTLYGIDDDLLCAVNNKMYYYKEAYITKSGHVMLIVKPYCELEDPTDHTEIMESENIYFLVEGV